MVDIYRIRIGSLGGLFPGLELGLELGAADFAVDTLDKFDKIVVFERK